MDERRDLVDREELRRRIAEDPFSASEVWEMHLDAACRGVSAWVDP